MAVFDEQHVSATTCSGSPAHGFVPRGAVPVSNQIGLQNRRVCSYGIQNLSGFFVKAYELVITNHISICSGLNGVCIGRR